MKSEFIVALLLLTCRIAGAEVPKHAGTRAGLTPVGAQPRGGLTGKIVYAHGGHGITADNKNDGHWSFQRGEGFEMIEDLGNYDQMAFFVDYLFRAGATVVPLRPVGHQTHEVVMDNDDSDVTFEGAWKTGKSSTYFGKTGVTPYREVGTSEQETAYARLESRFGPHTRRRPPQSNTSPDTRAHCPRVDDSPSPPSPRRNDERGTVDP